MTITYQDVPVKSAGGFRPGKKEIDAGAYWLQHYRNKLALDHLAKTAASFEVRRRAEVEMLIAERKMAYCYRHPNWEFGRVKDEVKQLLAIPRPILAAVVIGNALTQAAVA